MRKTVEIDLTRPECESIYAMCHVLGPAIGDRNEDIKSGMAAVLDQVPNDFAEPVIVPFTADAAASVLSLCCFAVVARPTGPHRAWIDAVAARIGQALVASSTKASIAIDGKTVFSTS